MIVAFTGGRDWAPHHQDAAVFLDFFVDNKVEEVRHGACPTGFDKWIDTQCMEWNRTDPSFIITQYPANWGKFGKSAGPRRNRLMLLSEPRPHILVHANGGSGTANAVSVAARNNIGLLSWQKIRDRYILETPQTIKVYYGQ